MTPDTFAARLHTARAAAGLSLQALATLAQLSRQAIHQFEHGQSEPTFSTAVRLADALGCSLDSFRPGHGTTGTTS